MKPEGEEEAKATEPVVVEEKKEEPKVEYVEEILGYSLDDYLSNKATVARKAAREAEAIKGQKVEAGAKKAAVTTIVTNLSGADTYAKVADPNVALLGFGSVAQEEPVAERRERGGRGGRGRGGNQQTAPRQGGRRPNAKQALKLTEEDFPALE